MAVCGVVVWNALQRVGLFPSATLGCQTPLPEKLTTDLLPVLLNAWRITADRRQRVREQQRTLSMLEWLEEQQSRGARLTLGMPGSAYERVERWIGPRLCWWTRGAPVGRRVGLVSSRLGRRLDEKPDWFRTLRTACVRLDRNRDILVSATSTTTFRFIRRCAALFDLPTLRIDTTDPAGWSDWKQRIWSFSDAREQRDHPTVFLSPCLDERFQLPNEIVETPVRDRVVVAMSEHVLVLHLRPQGNLQRLVYTRLTDSAWPAASVYLALGPSLVPEPIAQELQDAGAVGWILLDAEESAGESNGIPDAATSDSERLEDGLTRTSRNQKETPPNPDHFAQDLSDKVLMKVKGASNAASAIIPLPSAKDWCYLTHCTRRHAGPWPDQNTDGYIDDLLFESPQADHSPLATLKRIVCQRMIRASSSSVRGGYRIVSLTAVPLSELDRLHVFRVHRGRWDFEPYGICIRRDWLEQRGARPVLYGNDQIWQSLAEPDRPYFQLETTKPSEKSGVIDWSAEQEWRNLGDLDLRALPRDAGLLFVPEESEAEQLVSIAPWPVTISKPRPRSGQGV